VILVLQIISGGMLVWVAIGIRRRLWWGWAANWVVLAYVLCRGLLVSPPQSIVGFILFFAPLVLNGYYFANRRALFVPPSDEETREGSP